MHFFLPWEVASYMQQTKEHVYHYEIFMSFKFHNKRHLGNIHFVHMTIRLNSHSRPWWKRKQKDFHIMYQVQFLFIILFCYGCLRCNYKHLMMKNLNIVDQLCIFKNLNQFMLLELTTKIKVTPSCVISYNNQIITNFIARFSFSPIYI